MNKITYVVFALLVLVPALPVVRAWMLVLSRKASPSGPLTLGLILPLLLTTASCLLFLVGLFYQRAIGPDYSNRRFITIYANLGVALLIVLTSLIGRHPLKNAVALAAGAVSVMWLYLAVVSSVA